MFIEPENQIPYAIGDVGNGTHAIAKAIENGFILLAAAVVHGSLKEVDGVYDDSRDACVNIIQILKRDLGI